MNTISIITIAAVGIMSGYATYLINQQKNKLSILHGIVIAAAVGTITGLIGGYLTGVLSEDAFLASGVGTIIGFILGFLAGQPNGILSILSGSVSGLMGGVAGALFGISLKDQNPFLMLVILLIFYVIILAFVILFIKVETNEQFTLDTQAFSPFVTISAGVVLLSMFLFLYSSDIIKAPSTTASAQTQETTQTNGSDDQGKTASPDTELDVTKETAPTVKMEVTPTGYSPNVIHVKKGVPVKLEVHNPLENSCLSTLNMPDFGLSNINLKTGTTNLSFTPSAEGEYTFSCGMNMFKGKIIVED
jgi:heme/copper-type cytochrome/quinol oxidase subunit 2